MVTSRRARQDGVGRGDTFNQAIREALRGAKVVISLLTPTYFTRPFAMAELGAGWAGPKLIPLVVPPLDFDELHGALAGIQALRIDDPKALSSLFDEFDTDHANSDRWLKRNGMATYERHRDLFLAGLKAHPAAAEPATAAASQAPPEAAAPKPLSIEEEKRVFWKHVEDVRGALASVHYLVRLAHRAALRKEEASVAPSEAEELRELVINGYLLSNLSGLDGSALELMRALNTRISFSISPGSARSQLITQELGRLIQFLERSSLAFRLEYETDHHHAPSLKADAFWNEHDLLLTRHREPYTGAPLPRAKKGKRAG